MPSQKAISSQLPATQANRTPIAFVSQAPRRHTPAAAASNSATVLKELEQLEILPVFTTLSPDHPLRVRLTLFFTAIRKLISDDPIQPYILATNSKKSNPSSPISIKRFSHKTKPLTYKQPAQESQAFPPRLPHHKLLQSRPQEKINNSSLKQPNKIPIR